MLEVRDLVVGYGGLTAVRGVSLDVGEGELVAVVGPNGAGKTSLLRAISGLLKPRSGEVVLDGRGVTGVAAHRAARLGIASVPEGRGIIAPLTVEENLLMGGYVLGPSRQARARVQAVVDMFPMLSSKLAIRAGLLSGGEQQVLAVARGLMSRPRVLTLDEPSMGLAPIALMKLLEALRAVVATGTSILLCEQNASLTLEFAERTYILVGGEIVRQSGRGEMSESVLVSYLE